MSIKKFVAAGLLSVAALAAQSVLAEPIVGETYNLTWDGSTGYQGYGAVAHVLNGSGWASGSQLTAVGGYQMVNTSLGNEVVDAFCVDVFKAIVKANHGYQYVDGSSYLAAPTLNALGRLASNHLSQVNSDVSHAAFQLAVWEIVHETSGSWSLSNGSFSAAAPSGGVTDSITLASNWLNSNAVESNNMHINVYRNVTAADGTDSQSIAVFHNVPTPASWALMAIGFAGLMLGRRRAR